MLFVCVCVCVYARARRVRVRPWEAEQTIEKKVKFQCVSVISPGQWFKVVVVVVIYSVFLSFFHYIVGYRLHCDFTTNDGNYGWVAYSRDTHMLHTNGVWMHKPTSIYCANANSIFVQVQSNHWTVRTIDREEEEERFLRYCVLCNCVYEYLIDEQIECTREIKKMKIKQKKNHTHTEQTNWWKNQFDPFSRMSII